MTRKKPKLSHYIICDDIRREIGNKISLIGLYQETILVSSLPYIFPKLCFHIEFKDVKAGIIMRFKLITPTNTEIFTIPPMPVPLPHDVPTKRKYGIFVCDLEATGIKVTEEGVYRLQCILGEENSVMPEIKFNVQKRSKQIQDKSPSSG